MGRKLIALFTIALLVAAYAQGTVQNMAPYIDTGYYYPSATSDTIKAHGYSDTIQVIGANRIVAEIHVAAVAGTLFAVLLASNDSTHFTNLDATGDSLPMTVVGNYAIMFEHASIFRYYVLRFFEVTDGAEATYQFRVGSATNEE